MLEVGIIEHNGNRFAANGATIDGGNIACYPSDPKHGRVSLRMWNGSTFAELRGEYLREWWSESWGKTHTLMIRLGHGRFIGGLAYGNGNLFRGELFAADDDQDAEQQANAIAERWCDIDQEDFERDQYEQSLEPEDDSDTDDE